MNEFIRLVGENRAIEFLGIKLVGFNAENGKKLLFTIVFIFLVILLGAGAARTHALAVAPERQ